MVCEICSTCETTKENEEKAKIAAAVQKRSEDINGVKVTVTDVDKLSGFTTMTEGFDTNNFWRNINKFFNKNYNDRDINKIK